jgi:hypothetical protein
MNDAGQKLCGLQQRARSVERIKRFDQFGDGGGQLTPTRFEQFQGRGRYWKV